MFCTGFPRYWTIVPWEPDVPPVIVSPVLNFCCAEINNLFVPSLTSLTKTVAVALLVEPTIVSPDVKTIVEASSTILSPVSVKI